MEKLNYIDLNLYKDGWAAESMDIFRKMLEVWHSGHHITICHPNTCFVDKPVSRNVKDFKRIDWQGVKEHFNTEADNSYIAYDSDCIKALRYVYNRFRYEKNNFVSSSMPRHLAVIEEDQDGGKIVRCIFKASRASFQVAINPLYEKYCSKDALGKIKYGSDNLWSIKDFLARNVQSESE